MIAEAIMARLRSERESYRTLPAFRMLPWLFCQLPAVF